MDDTPKAPRKGRKRTEANGEAKPAFDKSKGLWVVWVWINGKRVKRSSKSKTTALMLLKDLQRLKAQGVDIPPDRLTIAEWVKMWIATKRAAGLESGSIQRYEEHYRLRIVPMLGKYSLLKLTSQHIQNSVNILLEDGLARATVTFYKAMVSAALDDAVRKGMLPRNVALGVTLPRLSRAKERSSLSPAQARAFLQAAVRLGAGHGCCPNAFTHAAHFATAECLWFVALSMYWPHHVVVAPRAVGPHSSCPLLPINRLHVLQYPVIGCLHSGLDSDCVVVLVLHADRIPQVFLHAFPVVHPPHGAAAFGQEPLDLADGHGAVSGSTF